MPASDHAQKASTPGLVLGLLAVVLFGASPPATRVAVVVLDPFFVTAARGAAAGLLALSLLAVMRRRIPWRDLPMLALIALLLVIGFPGHDGDRPDVLPSAHGGVILGLLPIATAVAAVFVAGERPSLFFWAMSLLGAALVVAFSLRDGGIVPSPADLLLIVAVGDLRHRLCLRRDAVAPHARMGGDLLGGRR